MEERFAYGLNPKKLGAVSAYLCDPASAPAEFLLLKSQYQAETGRAVERGALFFQIRQAFPPGEVTPEEANKIGYETAMRWTKGKYQFFVCTHIDKGHIHNHIYLRPPEPAFRLFRTSGFPMLFPGTFLLPGKYWLTFHSYLSRS